MIDRSIDQLIRRRTGIYCRTNSWSSSDWFNQFISMYQSIYQSINLSINKFINQSIYQSINQFINKSISQSINLPINKSINHFINQPINASMLNDWLLSIPLIRFSELREKCFKFTGRAISPIAVDDVSGKHLYWICNHILQDIWQFLRTTRYVNPFLHRRKLTQSHNTS